MPAKAALFAQEAFCHTKPSRTPLAFGRAAVLVASRGLLIATEFEAEGAEQGANVCYGRSSYVVERQ